MSNKKEIAEVKSLRWLANMFPFTKNPQDETDRMTNAINVYVTAGADKIEELDKKCEALSRVLKNIEKYPVVTLCGSTRFKSKFEEVKRELTLKGYIVLSLGVFGKCDLIPEIDEKKLILEEMHKQRIGMSDEIYVINVDGYIGESTRKEIEFAKSLGKKINYLEN